MSIWVCRTGLSGQFEEIFFQNNCICLTREGFDFDLRNCEKDQIIMRISEINPDAARQTVSNTWSQINIFASKMEVGDIVIIPKKNSTDISVATVASEYCFSTELPFPLNHSRKIKLLATDIKTTNFPQDIRYSLGAFRTVFGIRQETRLLEELQRAGVCISSN